VAATSVVTPRTTRTARRRLASAAPLALLLVAAAALPTGCSPTLRTYVEHLDADGPIYTAAVVEPPRAPAPAIARSVVVARFKDVRPFADRTHVGAAVADSFAAVFSLGVAALTDARNPDHRNQPMAGLEDDLPRRVANYEAAANTFSNCNFVDRAASAVLERPSRRERSTTADLIVSGEVRQFRGTCELAPREVGRPRPDVPVTVDRRSAEKLHGLVEVLLTVTDVKSGAVVWSDVVAVDVPLDDKVGELDEYSETTLSNKLAVASIGPFLAAVDATLREKVAPLVAK
jgi:hypothetical protein